MLQFWISTFKTIPKVFSLYDVTELISFDLSYINKDWMKEKINHLIKLVRDADIYMTSEDNIGWIGNGEVPNITELKESPLCENKNKFSMFIENFNKSFVEALDNNSRDTRKYFWNGFKSRYPELQHVLDKIRLYRNKNKHLKLTDDNEKKYQAYLMEDLNGYMPDYVKNGFLILQVKIINELEKSIVNVIKDLKN